MSIYVGIDVHKRFCQAALMNEDGTILHELKFENTIEGAHRLVNLARLTPGRGRFAAERVR